MYELIGLAAELDEAAAQAVQVYEMGLARYRAQAWDAAEAAFRDCLARVADDRPSRVMLERIAVFRQTPPDTDWDGSWTAASK